ncbi:MAG: 2-oxoacid:acceptor oxidoreductase subunit alpha [Candidatus Aerophobetes bacterium]|nr:2-oxoacid:acceptor oxidoreductase subunit alpha [Candidatus Aerophobetes bacterium]
MSKARIMSGNEAIAEGALAAGVRFFAGYPITPSSEIAEVLSELLPQVGGKFIQMEDELSSMGAIIGASLAGLKSMTATSGPGFSLMQENIGFAWMAEVPCVIVDVQRGGPSTGLPTKASQSDVMQVRWGRHGDQNMIALAPSSVRESFDLVIDCVNLSEKYRTPVVLLLDEIIAHMREKVILPEKEEIKIVERKKPVKLQEKYLPYEVTEDGVPPMANFGEGYRYHVTGLTHDEAGFPTSEPEKINQSIRRIYEKIEKHKDEIIRVEEKYTEDAEIIVFAYGSVARSACSAVKEARGKGIKVGLIKPITLWPFPYKKISGVADSVKRIIVPEMNMGQIIEEVKKVGSGKVKVESVNRVDGELITPSEIMAKIEEVS